MIDGINKSAAFDKIYHSESMHEMLCKADLYGIDIADFELLSYLARTTSYHHAFWPHTKKRFYAFKNLLKHLCKKLVKEKPETIDKLHSAILKCLNSILSNSWQASTPGGQQEIKNLEQLIGILQHCIENSSSQSYQKKKKAIA